MNKNLSNQLTVFSDGGSRGNPGHAAYGFVIYNKDNHEIARGSKYIGIATNNQAEYRGVLGALVYLSDIYTIKDCMDIKIHFFLDSELIVKQMNGEYKIKNEDLKPIYWEIRENIMKLGGKVSFTHVPREKNKVADKLVNEELDNNK